MLKRKIALLIAGGLFSGVAAAATDLSSVPNDTYIIWKPLPTQMKYFEERAAAVRAEGAPLSVFATMPSNDTRVIWKPLPAQAKYFEERAARVAQEQREPYPTIRVNAGTENITVEHLGTVRFVDDNGHAFVWQADTLGETALPLKAVAPSDFKAGTTEIYVRHPSSHIPG